MQGFRSWTPTRYNDKRRPEGTLSKGPLTRAEGTLERLARDGCERP